MPTFAITIVRNSRFFYTAKENDRYLERCKTTHNIGLIRAASHLLWIVKQNRQPIASVNCSFVDVQDNPVKKE